MISVSSTCYFIILFDRPYPKNIPVPVSVCLQLYLYAILLAIDVTLKRTIHEMTSATGKLLEVPYCLDSLRYLVLWGRSGTPLDTTVMEDTFSVVHF